MLEQQIIYALIGTGATCLATVLGAAMVFVFKKDMGEKMQKMFLGFAAGIMIAASVWSLLIPAMDMATEQGQIPALPVGIGFVAGGAFLWALDRLLPHMHIGSGEQEGLPCHWRRSTMVVFAVTLHNIPEGMAVGLALAAAAMGETASLSAAIGLAVSAFVRRGEVEGVSVRFAVGRGRADLRSARRARFLGSGGHHALGAVLCGGRDDLRRRRRTHPRSASRRAFPCGNDQRDGGISRDDAPRRHVRVTRAWWCDSV